MKKVIFIVIGGIVIIGAIFAFRNFSNPSVQVTQSTKPAATLKQPTAAANILDRIETAIREKLKR